MKKTDIYQVWNEHGHQVMSKKPSMPLIGYFDSFFYNKIDRIQYIKVFIPNNNNPSSSQLRSFKDYNLIHKNIDKTKGKIYAKNTKI